MTKTLAVATAVLALVLALIPATPTAAGGPAIDGSAWSPAADLGSALVQLTGDPVSTASATKSNEGKKIDLASAKVKSYRAQLSALRNEFKEWLRANAPAAKVTGEFDISLNAVGVSLGGTSLATIQSAPMVLSAQYQLLYRPMFDPDLALIHAVEAWGAGGGAGAGVQAGGTRVKVGIIDTGIDVTHPCFSDSGYPTATRQGPLSLTNNKVIVAKVFYNKANVRGLTPAAVQSHGTHVAGTVGCNYGLTNTTTTVDGVSVSYGVLGVAPGVLLGNYNVFPGNVDNARSEDILNALEAAYADGMDIVNLSLGGNGHGIHDLLTMAIDDLDQAGMISAVAAGNEGPGHYTVSSPGSAARALTAGAMTVGHFIASPVTVGGNSYGAATGDFATVTTDLTAPLGVVLSGTTLGTACAALPSGSLSGKIALISRGTCSFSTKIRNAETAGALATLVVNNSGGDPVGMAQDGTPNQPTRPAYMLGLEHKAALVAANGQLTTIGAGKAYFQTANSNIMAGFSSQGPTDVDFRVKPDVVAPGVNVLSSIPQSFCAVAARPCWAFFQGTSMATPHLAGSAAVVLGQHPTWSAAQVRSAIVNTADQGVLKTSTGLALATDPNLIGAGRDNVLSAVNARVALSPVSVSFGAVSAGAGQTRTATISLSRLSGPSADSVTVTASTGSGITYSASLSGSSITVTMTAAKRASRGDHQAVLRISAGGTEIAHAILYTFAK